MPSPLWWSNWYTTCSRLFPHHRSTNKWERPWQTQVTPKSPVAVTHKGKPFVLVMVITICGKHNSAKLINRNIQSCLPNRLSNKRNIENNGCVNNNSSSAPAFLYFHSVFCIPDWNLIECELSYSSNQVVVYGLAASAGAGAAPAHIDITLSAGVRRFPSSNSSSWLDLTFREWAMDGGRALTFKHAIISVLEMMFCL